MRSLIRSLAHPELATKERPGRFGSIALSILAALAPALAVPVAAQAEEPADSACRGTALVHTLENGTDRVVDGLHLVLHGPESIGVAEDNPFGTPKFQALDPEGLLHLRFGGAEVAPGETVRIALCAESADANGPSAIDPPAIDAVSVGRQAAVAWLVGDATVAPAPALPTLGHRLIAEDRGDGSFSLGLELRQAEAREVRIESAQVAFGPRFDLAELGAGAAESSVNLQWFDVALDTRTLAPPAGKDPADTDASDGEADDAASTLSVTRASLDEIARFDDDRALFVRTVVSAAAFPENGEGDTPPQGRVETTRLAQIDLASQLGSAFYTRRALEEAGLPADAVQDLTIQRSRLALPLSGVEAQLFKLVDTTPNGAAEAAIEIALDKAGQRLDVATLLADEDRLATSLYGTLDPALAARLAEAAPDTTLRVVFWLRAAEDDGEPAIERPAATADLDPEAADALYAALDDRARRATERLAVPFADRLAAFAGSTGGEGSEPIDPRTLELETMEMAPMVYATLPVDAVLHVATWPEVDRVYSVETYTTELAIAGETVGRPAVHATGTLGGSAPWGERLAVIEVQGGRIAGGNPYLSPTVNLTNSCQSNHGTAVAGIVASTHGTHRGMAPASRLYMGGSCAGSASQLQSATSWAIGQGARAVNLSWGSASGTSPGALDRAYDQFVIGNWRTIVKSAGNEAGTCRSQTGKISMPGRGFNVLTVGNFDDRNTANRGDDAMHSCSSYVDPPSSHGDRQKPEVSAPGSLIDSTTNASPWTGSVGSGTSYAAPVVTGGAGLLFERHGALRVWPEAVKAISMVTATHNVEGASRLSDRDGAGGVRLDLAADVARRAGIQSWNGRSYSCASPSNLDVETVALTAGVKARVAMVWNQPTSYAQYANRPSADLDLRILAPNGSTVASSLSWDNTYEIVEFTPPVSGTYTLRVRKFRCDQSPEWLAWAWWQPRTTSYARIQGVSNKAQGAGLEIADLDGNGQPDMVLMAYHAPAGPNSFRYRIGWNLDAFGKTSTWSGIHTVGGVGWEGQGASVEIGDLDGNGQPDMVLMAYDNPWNGNTFRYRIGWNLVGGVASSWSGTHLVGGVGWEGQGAGIELIDLDGNGRDEMIAMAYDAPAGPNDFRYRIGWNLGTTGAASSWSATQFVGGVGWEGQGAGAAIGDIDGNGSRDLVLMAYDDPAGAATFRYRVGSGLGATGSTGAWSGTTLLSGVGWNADGADPELYDIDGDGDLELFLMAYDDPFFVSNTFRYRVTHP